jgi:hypothetical protein
MSVENHLAGSAAKLAAHGIKELKPLQEHKSPAIAFFLGLAFGALGVAIYFKSAKDFFLCIGIFIGITILMPLGGEILGWGFASVYGAWRAHTSNEKLGVK